MILTVSELRDFITTNDSDNVLKARLQGIELLVRSYTNNNFQQRSVRGYCGIRDNVVLAADVHIKDGDTVEITESQWNTGIYTVTDVEGGTLTLDAELDAEDNVLVTRVVYPQDIKMGVVNLMKWEMDRRDKVGLASESISRHSQSFVDLTGDNSTMGYPKALMGFLAPYKRARFGQGVSV